MSVVYNSNLFDNIIKVSQLINRDNKYLCEYKNNSVYIAQQIRITYNDDVYKVYYLKKLLFESANIELIASFVRSKLGC